MPISRLGGYFCIIYYLWEVKGYNFNAIAVLLIGVWLVLVELCLETKSVFFLLCLKFFVFLLYYCLQNLSGLERLSNCTSRSIWAELRLPLSGDSAVDFYIYGHYVCCLAVGWGCWVIACCLEGLYTICLISTPLQLINTQLFAYVCIFHIQVLVMCWFCQLSSLSKEMFSL